MTRFSYHNLMLKLLMLSGCVQPWANQEDRCKYEIVESLPGKMQFSTPLSFTPRLTHEALIEMIDGAKNSLKIASFYWSLSPDPEFNDDPTTQPGKRIMRSIMAAVKRGVKLQVILDKSTHRFMSNQEDIKKLEALGVLKYLNMKQVLGLGVLHTKFLIADTKAFYVGSSNFDWRSYSQIKDIGIAFTECPVLAKDLDKVFKTYSLIADTNQLPSAKIPGNLKTEINMEHPLDIRLGQFDANMFIASSPPAFNGLKNKSGRTDDIEALLDIINKANKQIDISVMNYSPTTYWPETYWPRIDNALKQAVLERKVRVRLLFSEWVQSKEVDKIWYKSLNEIQSESLKGGGIQVRLFKVPADESRKKIAYDRVKHDKYMVTDNGLYIGTSNWSPDYFTTICGVSVIVKPSNVDGPIPKDSIMGNMQELFERDFTSEFSYEL